MIRAKAVTVAMCALALFFVLAPSAAGDPGVPGATAYLIGKCYDPSQPVEQMPATVVYGCDQTSVMQDMTWTSWGADGAQGTGTDNSLQCQPNCAQGQHLFNPIIVHAWNPKPAAKPGCPAGVEFYSDFTVAYPQGVPPWIKPGTGWGEDVAFIYVDGMPAVYFFDQGSFSCTPLN